MANGETAIFFIRRLDSPDTPFYTLELKGKKITQCRTKNNKPYNGQVKEFAETWLREVVNGSGKKNKKTPQPAVQTAV
jgi:hypothetical protein